MNRTSKKSSKAGQSPLLTTNTKASSHKTSQGRSEQGIHKKQEENFPTLQEHLAALSKGLPEPGMTLNDMIRSWVKDQGSSTREAANKAYLIGRELVARRRVVAHKYRTDWLKKESEDLKLSVRSLQLYMQVAKGLDAKSATPLHISILDNPLREIPKALRVAAGKEKPRKKQTEPPLNVWTRKLRALVDEALEDALIRPEALVVLEDAAKSLGTRASSETVNAHPESTIALRKKNLTEALALVPRPQAKSMVQLRVTKRDKDGEIEMLTGSGDTILGVVLPAVVGEDAPDLVSMPHAALEKYVKCVSRASGTIEFVKLKGELVLYGGKGKAPLEVVQESVPPPWPKMAKESDDDELWPQQELTTILSANLALARALAKFPTEPKPKTVVYSDTLCGQPRHDNQPILHLGCIGHTMKCMLPTKRAAVLAKLLEAQKHDMVRLCPGSITLRGERSFGTVLTEESAKTPLIPAAWPTGDNAVLLPVTILKGVVEGSLGGSREKPWGVYYLSLESTREVIISRFNASNHEDARWDVPALKIGDAIVPGKWRVKVWQPLLEAVLSVWPHHLIQIDALHSKNTEAVRLSTPPGFSPSLQVILTQPEH